MKDQPLSITDYQKVTMLSDNVAGALKEYYWRYNFNKAQILMKNDDHGPRGENPPIIPYAPITYSRVFTGTHETGSFNHHSQITKFNNKYYFAFSNGYRDEEAGGQQVLLSSSDNARDWSPAINVAGRAEGEELVAYNTVAIFEDKGKLHIIAKKEDTIIDATSTGMRRINPETTELQLYSSADGTTWEHIFSFDHRLDWIFEAPRVTAQGKLFSICHTRKDGPAALLWPGDDILEQPEIIKIPEPKGTSFPYGESSWYQTDEGRMVIFWRDEGGSCKLYVNYSDDGGESFSPLLISDIPDSMSRVFAGRLSDGRYFLCNNAFPNLLDRQQLMLMLSDDGYTFNKVFMVRNDPTMQRCVGLLKVDGYQYPCCLVEEGRLVIGHSVNKEDIECTIVNTSAL